jgi:predicted acetyltransferase
MAGRLEVRKFRLDDGLEAEFDLRRRAFGPITGADEWDAMLSGCIEAGQMMGVFDDGRPIASARYFAMRQWWHGRSMPMAGVAGVKVAPEERGRGIGRMLMASMLDDLVKSGFPVSTLYPSTLPLYRSLGWENAGGRYETVLPARALAALAGPDPAAGPWSDGTGSDGSGDDGTGNRRGNDGSGNDGTGNGGTGAGSPAEAAGLHRAAPADAAAVIAMLGRVHQALRDSGPITIEAGEVERWLDDVDHFAYLAGDGFLSYRWAKGHEEIAVEYLVAESAATARTFWQILGTHATMAERVRACLAPTDPVAWLLHEPTAVTTLTETWMLRLIDAAQAIAGRGYPSGASVQAALDVRDQAVPANSGHWMLEISGGSGKLAPAAGEPGPRALRLGARGLAGLFGGVPVATLRRAGLVSGNTGIDDALDCAFAGPAFMYDYF